MAVGDFEVDLPPVLMTMATLILRHFAKRAVNVHLDSCHFGRPKDVAEVMEVDAHSDAPNLNRHLFEGGAAHT